MDAIIQFFTGISNAVVGVIDFVISLFRDFVVLIDILGGTFANIFMYFSFLPDNFISIIITIFGVVLLYKILGREG